MSNTQLKSGSLYYDLIPAQGPNTFIVPLFIHLVMNYGGTNVFTNTPTIGIDWEDPVGASIATISPGATFWGTAINGRYFGSYITGTFSGNSASDHINELLSLKLSALLTGNAGNDNTVRVNMSYYVMTIV